MGQAWREGERHCVFCFVFAGGGVVWCGVWVCHLVMVVGLSCFGVFWCRVAMFGVRVEVESGKRGAESELNWD